MKYRYGYIFGVWVIINWVPCGNLSERQRLHCNRSFSYWVRDSDNYRNSPCCCSKSPRCPNGCGASHVSYIISNLGDIWICNKCKTVFDSYSGQILATASKEGKAE